MNIHGLPREGENMEHRWKKRIEGSLDVVVHGLDGLMLHGRIRDISLDGMFIQSTSHTLSKSRVVEIEIPRCGYLHGRVIHAGDEGFGVMFRAVGSKKQCLLELLLSEKCSVCSRP